MPVSEAAQGTCPRCEGRGWVIEEDGQAGAARPCDCRREVELPGLLRAAAIPPRYRGCTLSNFQVAGTSPGQKEQLLAARAAARGYVDAFVGEDGRFCEAGLLFIGPPGVGKTHLAVAILSELIQRYRVRGLFVDFTSLLHQIQSTFDPGSPESQRQVLDPVVQAEVLVLDELGARKPSPWVSDILYLVMNTRYTSRLATLFTTNYGLERPAEAAPLDRGPAPAHRETLATRIPATLLSRLYEMAKPVTIDVEDFRREHKSFHQF